MIALIMSDAGIRSRLLLRRGQSAATAIGAFVVAALEVRARICNLFAAILAGHRHRFFCFRHCNSFEKSSYLPTKLETDRVSGTVQLTTVPPPVLVISRVPPTAP